MTGHRRSPSTQPTTTAELRYLSAAQRRDRFGELLFPKITRLDEKLAPKITGMLLEMPDTEILILLSDEGALRDKVREATDVLRLHGLDGDYRRHATGSS